MAVVSSAQAGTRAVELGATVLQLRAPVLTARQLEAEATALVAAASVPILISVRVDIALAAGAAGVNLAEADIGAQNARRLLGDAIVGCSVHSVDGAKRAESEGADYVIFGPVWPSTTHRGVAPRGLDALSQVAHAVSIPVLAIGGLHAKRVARCLAAGAAGYAGIRMFE
jgi:thiazole tautomerase (transcriptional regulator TenI)